ncbi:hypothetical protein BN988_00248 [Oceanobacillus picturae]|uniref:Uncharacterized protein n=2 Tax=Oceanobacillus TaxID=182709 RepID=W9AFU8_9BACI|nr:MULTISPECIES: hypothetical protein [Oceanobacillus]AVQ99459.1 hypothetical protein OBCHQ24_10690 [Oceanobacillus iheyensis]MCG3420741.1 hypothetical protein [Oceanobacillus jordanicus]RIU93616.1 hypothetical protein D1864_06475 [Oceanobacillus picturae]CDO01802.1 hypothetical protein BN988_00248 [Oceanobacillus picturae]
MTEIIDFLSNIASKIMEFILVAFFWLADVLANLLIKIGLVEKESDAIVIGIIIMFIIFVIIMGATIGSKYHSRGPYDGGGDD